MKTAFFEGDSSLCRAKTRTYEHVSNFAAAKFCFRGKFSEAFTVGAIAPTG